MLELYWGPGSIALASMIALNDAGAEHRLRRIDFAREEQKSAEYLAINPKARVPTLVTPQGRLTETPAILAFIAQTHPDTRLAPTNAWDFAKMQELNAYLCATLHVAHAHRMRGPRWADDPAAWEAMKHKVPQSVGECFAYIEAHALTGPYAMGEQYTVADPYLFTVSRWMEADSLDPARYPKVTAHREMMASRESAWKALAEYEAPEAATGA
ncbi:MAG TPA: glutathione S-transferase [Paracoccaceae bacterium]|nr:glutathione S-transferase [Paracoccaceae bacterium]